MKPRYAWLATLLLGLGIGFLAGRGTAPEPSPPRSPPMRETEALWPTASPALSAPERKRTPRPVEPSGDAGELPGREPPEEGYGVLVVDFTGLDLDEPSFVIPVTLLNGGVALYECDWSGDAPGLGSMELRPGTYHPSWTLPGRAGRFGRTVVIEAGRVTRLCAADSADALPVPPFEGTGRLFVRVLSTAGTPIPSLRVALEADLEAFEDELEGWTDSAGGWTVDARPGPAVLRVGDQLVPVTVRLGRTTPVEVLPVAVGELRFVLPEGAYGGFRLRRTGERPTRVKDELHSCGWHGFNAYLAPGEYAVYWAQGAETGCKARVRAHEETAFTGPPGILSVRCACGGEHRHSYFLVLSRRGEHGWSELVRLSPTPDGDSSPLVVLPWLEAGLYRVEVRGLHDGEQVVEVEVGYTEQDCVLPFPE